MTVKYMVLASLCALKYRFNVHKTIKHGLISILIFKSL